MPHIQSESGRRALTTLALVVLAAVALAACGSSSKSPTTTAATTTTAASSASANTGTATTKAGTPAPVRRSSLRECLHKQGITLPARKPGQTGGFFGPGGQLPPGVTRQQLNAALGKCASQTRGRFRAGVLRLQPAAKKAFTEFAACMRQSGIHLPPPDTSGSGPIFSTKGLNASSPKFRAASAKCRAVLASAFRAGGGALRPGGNAAPGAHPPTG
jgi:hypothetical protein